MKTIKLLAIFLVITLGSAGCSTPAVRRVNIQNFSLNLPTEVKLVKQQDLEDFILFDCNVKRKTILSFYVGNAPGFPHQGQGDAKITHTMLNWMKAEETQSATDQGVSRDVKAELSNGHWPRFVHFWYSDKSHDEAEIADRIINSIKQ